ncbi:MAG: tRNA (adenosine(37)-N6)-threonylcarbamoyltransferase complex dimerization subunit type 1 TsaB [Candidatus Omnitrophota bacterium]|nr:tRNA (adenosine(37)-N6)-threonylcarbamoyltransferase complex dimerization subunit type 1 TsaB [Candidatus Omnitrophota bacterium]
MTILAIDTSTDYLSLAIMRDEKILARFHRRSRMRHSSLLVPMIDRLLKKARVKLEAIDCFAISIGPGSFTGLRIGAVTVKGFSYALNKPIVTVPTLDVIARNVKGFKGIICPVLDARKNKVYACLYKSDGKNVNKISKYLLLPAKELIEKTAGYDKIVFLGDGYCSSEQRSCESRTSRHWHPKAEVVARLGAEYYRGKRFVTAEDLEPMYLYSRECDIKGI